MVIFQILTFQKLHIARNRNLYLYLNLYNLFSPFIFHDEIYLAQYSLYQIENQTFN